MSKRVLALILALAMAAFIGVAFTGCGNGDDNGAATTQAPENGTTAPADDPAPPAADYITLGDTFVFNDLEITFGEEFGWTTVTSQFSDNYGDDVFYLPISITNLRDETHGLNTFAVNHFGSEGTSQTLFFGGFNFDADWGSNMRPGVTQECHMYFLYDGDGEYVAEFTFGFGDATEVIFQVEKP